MNDRVSTDPSFSYDPFKFDTIIGQLDPFIGSVTQTHRLRAFCEIMVNGVNITNRLKPHLISVRVRDEGPDPSAEIEIDDRDGTMPLPPLGAHVVVALGWATESMRNVFRGTIQDFEHGFGRKQGGRRMWVTAKGLDHFTTTAKEPEQNHAGEGAPPGQKEGQMIGLPSWIQQMGKSAGISAQVDSLFAGIKQDYWAQGGASFMHQVQSLAEEHGFVHQFHDGNQLDVEKRGNRGLSCIAKWRDNLIAWRVRPFSARSAFKGGQQQWFDHMGSHWEAAAQQFGLTNPFNSTAATNQPQAPAPTESGAGNSNAGQQEGAQGSAFGNGRIIINGEPAARWNSKVLLTGARPGVDGLYTIDAVEHVYSRQGFITTLEVWPAANAPRGENVGTFFDLPRPQPNIG